MLALLSKIKNQNKWARRFIFVARRKNKHWCYKYLHNPSVTSHAGKVGYDTQLGPDLWWGGLAPSTVEGMGKVEMTMSVGRDSSQGVVAMRLVLQASAMANVSHKDMGAADKWLGCCLTPGLRLCCGAGCEQLLNMNWWTCHMVW